MCDIYGATPAQDADGGVEFVYPPAPTLAAQRCSAQPVETREVYDQDRLIRETTWKLMFAAATGVKNRDMLVITDPAGVRHTAIVHIEQDQAGRGSAYVVYAIERQ